MSSIPVADLLGRPWCLGSGDCWAIMRAVLERAGRAVPSDIPGEGVGLDGKGLRGLRRALDVGALKVADWPTADLRLGDVLAIDTKRRDRIDHVATVVSLSPLRVLHTSQAQACHAIDPRRLGGVRAVYRFPAVRGQAVPA